MTPRLLRFADDGSIPNNPRLPVLLHRAALPPGDPAAAEATFARNGWPPAWRNGIHRHHHYHPNAHEALAITHGEVRVQLGGAEGPTLTLTAGDVVVLSAGVGHRNLGASPDLLVVGAYSPGAMPREFTALRTSTPKRSPPSPWSRTPSPTPSPAAPGLRSRPRQWETSRRRA